MYVLSISIRRLFPEIECFFCPVVFYQAREKCALTQSVGRPLPKHHQSLFVCLVETVSVAPICGRIDVVLVFCAYDRGSLFLLYPGYAPRGSSGSRLVLSVNIFFLVFKEGSDDESSNRTPVAPLGK